MYKLRIFIIGLVVFLTACSEGPESLQGTWKMTGLMPVTVIFRDGEEESMGLISQVTYKHEGNDILVTYTDGMAKGTTMRVTMTGPDTAVTGMGKLIRVR